VSGLVLGANLAPGDVAGAAVTALAGRASQLQASLPPGVPHHWLRLRSVAEHFAGQQRPQADALVGVASSSPEVLRRVRTVLSAAGLDADALEFRDAREAGWRNGLHLCAFVIADVVTARRLAAHCTVREMRLLSEGAVEELQRFVALVTDRKVS
jgi:hypothetical protein